MSVPARDLRATYWQAFGPLVIVLICFSILRGWVLEPFTIPSGSMLPSLLLHDYIVVRKFEYGLRVPFSSEWILRWGRPKPGDVVVFRSPQDPQVYFVKRVAAVGGDRLAWSRHGRLRLNGEWLRQEEAQPSDLVWGHPEGSNDAPTEAKNDYMLVQEYNGFHSYQVWLDRRDDVDDVMDEVVVPEGEFYVVGDNRSHSHDSRYFGGIPEKSLLGRATRVLLSCGGTVQESATMCDPKTIRWPRVWMKVL